MNASRRLLLASALLLAETLLHAQQGTLSPAERRKRIDTEKELQSLAIVERKLMLSMRDGVRLATDVYRPKHATGKVPVVFVRTPYNFNFWDVKNGVPADMTRALTAVKRGYALVLQNERGHFFSEGHYDILGAPVSDGEDALEWMRQQPWSNGRVGTTGCSSTAEYQMAVAAQGHPAYAAMNVQGFGAGIGRVGPYYEQGNWYRGGAMQMLFISWLYGEQNQVRPMFPPDTKQQDLVRAAKAFDLAPQLPPVEWDEAFWHLPVQDVLRAIDAPHGIFAAHSQRPRLVPRRAVARRHEARRPGPVVHVLVRRVGRTEPGDVQPRAKPRARRNRRAAVGDHRAGRALRVHADERRHAGGRAQHGRRAARLRRDRLRLLRQVPEGRERDAGR
jgi:hypothetical protein